MNEIGIENKKGRTKLLCGMNLNSGDRYFTSFYLWWLLPRCSSWPSPPWPACAGRLARRPTTAAPSCPSSQLAFLKVFPLMHSSSHYFCRAVQYFSTSASFSETPPHWHWTHGRECTHIISLSERDMIGPLITSLSKRDIWSDLLSHVSEHRTL